LRHGIKAQKETGGQTTAGFFMACKYLLPALSQTGASASR
jgi:hypothetical protein